MPAEKSLMNDKSSYPFLSQNWKCRRMQFLTRLFFDINLYADGNLVFNSSKNVHNKISQDDFDNKENTIKHAYFLKKKFSFF
jgi:hypothetical protein